MTVEAICFSAHKGEAMVAVAAIEVATAAGIVGDRYHAEVQRYPGQNITLIEAEEIEAFNARNGTRLSLTDPRRNLITRNVRLNALVGVEFSVGSVRLRGVELCEPCSTLSGYLAPPHLSKRDFVREFTHRCGLRADVLSAGRIRVGDTVLVAEVRDAVV